MLWVLVGGAMVLAAAVAALRHDARWIGVGALLLGGVLVALVPALAELAPRTSLPVTRVLATVTHAMRVAVPVLAAVFVAAALAHGLLGLYPRARNRGTPAALALAGLTTVGVLVALVLVDDSTDDPLLFLAGLTMLLGIGWVAFLFVAFVLYAQLYPALSRLVHRGGPPTDYVLVHGIKLRGGQPVPSLIARLDGGIDAWRRLHARDPRTLLIVSGGHHPDERRSEADAMAEHARAAGVPPDVLLVEDRATNTRDNLVLGDELARQAADAPDAAPRGLSVTSGYHVLRVASIARHLRLPIEVCAARTPWWAIPGGYLSEFAAMLLLRPAASTVTAVMVVLPLPLAIGYVLAVT